MKPKNTLGFVCLIVLFAMGCERTLNDILTKSDNVVRPAVDIDGEPDKKPSSESVFIGDAGGRFGADRYVLNTATVTGDTLTVNVSYGGGCRIHQFTLVASESFMESFPVQLHISLAHNANNDLCRAWLAEDYHFDLTPIKAMFQEGYRQKTGTIVLRLKNAPEELVYEFAM